MRLEHLKALFCDVFAMYELDKIKILLIDSQSSVRGMTETVLKEFGAKHILPYSSSQEALATGIEQSPDIIIVDHIMRPQDGVAFTNLLRHKNMTTRLTPVIFTSSLSAKNRVYEARDAGITEFLAKPYTAESLYKRIFQITENPRHFVESKGFSGPDRRRRNAPSPGTEKRGREKLKDVRILEPSHILRQKIGTGGLSPAVIKAAQIRMEEYQTNTPFAPIAMESLDWQRRVLDAFIARKQDSVTSLRDLQDAWSMIKGNAEVFGFMLVREIAANLTDFLDLVTEINGDSVSIVEAHENATHVALKKNIKDKNNPFGYALLDELKKANIRYFNKYAPTNQTI
jgi:two-component system, chemotaxis family, chemotaxis protein CheY